MILISNFFNEQYMLPWWLKNNKKYFDHGVLIDYFSTDRSRDIIKEICPDWEIRQTEHEHWDPLLEDAEMMEVEREFNDYKMILTLTEFLVGNIEYLPERLSCLSIPIIRMVDAEPERKPTHEIPLIRQKQDGYKARVNGVRFLHTYPDGDYLGAGRHKTGHDTIPCDNIKVWKYQYSPWTEEFIQRRLQFKDNMSKRHLEKKNWGKQHKLNREQLQKQHEKELEKL